MLINKIFNKVGHEYLLFFQLFQLKYLNKITFYLNIY